MRKLAYIPEQVILASGPSAPSTGYIKMYRKSDGWYELNDAGDEERIIPFPKLFQALKTTSQTSTTAWSDVVGWQTPAIAQSIYSFDDTTGVLTVNDTGIFEVCAHLLYDDTGNNRVETAVKLVDSSGDVLGALDRQYSMRNNGSDEGSCQFSGFLYEVTTSGETLNLQEQRVGATANITAGRFTVKKIG